VVSAEVSEGEAADQAVVEGMSVFSFRGDIATLGRAVNSHTMFQDQAAVAVDSGEQEITVVVKHQEDPGLHHMADSRDKEEDTMHSKERVVGMANQWAQLEVINNKGVPLVTVSQIITEVKPISQEATEARVVSHLVMVAKPASQSVLGARAGSQEVTVVVEVDSKMATVVADIIKHRRIATLSLCNVADITSHLARLHPEDTGSRVVMHNKELEDQVTLQRRVVIISKEVDIQVAVHMGNREEEEEVLLAAMEHHREEEDGKEVILSIEKMLTVCVAVFTNFLLTFYVNLIEDI